MDQKLASAFVKAQREFRPALKSSTNPHFKSQYADLATCVDAVIDALHNNGIALVQHQHECQDGVLVETVFLHESGAEYSTGKLHVPADKATPQGYGSALTYARRYSLMAACGIAPEDDDGNAAKPSSTPAPKQPESLADAKRRMIAKAVDYRGNDGINDWCLKAIDSVLGRKIETLEDVETIIAYIDGKQLNMETGEAIPV